jgi:hypothetical protein
VISVAYSGWCLSFEVRCVLVLLAYNVNISLLVFYICSFLRYWMWRHWGFFLFRVFCVLLTVWTCVFVLFWVSMWTLHLDVFPRLFSFNASVSRPSSERVASNRMTDIEYSLKRMRTYYLFELSWRDWGKNTKFLSQNSRSAVLGLNQMQSFYPLTTASDFPFEILWLALCIHFSRSIRASRDEVMISREPLPPQPPKSVR